MSDLVCKRLVIEGLVQGVSFRASTQREAMRIGALCGFVRNLANSDVEIIVQGNAAAVAALVSWARKGPPTARVDRLTEEDLTVDPKLPSFNIRH